MRLGLGLGLGRRRRSGGGLIAWDNFDRANNATTLGTSTSGHSWVAHNSSVWGVTGNQAYYVSGGTANLTYATIESGVSDGVVSVTLSTITASQEGICFRFTSAQNTWVLYPDPTNSRYVMFKNVGGAQTIMWTGGPAPANGDVVDVLLSDSDITPRINGVLYPTVTDGSHLTATSHGLFNLNASGALGRYNNFSVAA